MNGPTVDAIARPHRHEPRRVLEAVLAQLRLDQRQRQRRAVDRAVDERHHVRHAADVILVAVRQHERGDAPLLLQVGQVRNDPIDAQQFGIGEHDARVDDDGRLAPGERQHVHAELAETAERDDFEHLRYEMYTPTPARFLAERVRRREPPVGGSIRRLGAPESIRGGMVATTATADVQPRNYSTAPA